jgi:hypothetical protein
MSGIRNIIPEVIMKKQIKIRVIVLAGAFLAGIAWSTAYAEPKKDVSDPVLNEIIQSLGPRMPRFVDKHGKDVFVADEAVTRGSFVFALYEYDKSLKLPKKDYVSRMEFDELNARLKMIEKGGGGRPVARDESEKSAIDITQVLNDLAPNMPMLLDDSLNKSKVFVGLRYEVMNLKPQEGTASDEQLQLKKNLEQTRNDLNELSKRIETMEKSPQQADSGARSDEDTQKIKKELAQTHTRLTKLEKRMNDIDGTKKISEQVSVASSGQKDSIENTSVLAKLSMGLSMVAALFIAR